MPGRSRHYNIDGLAEGSSPTPSIGITVETNIITVVETNFVETNIITVVETNIITVVETYFVETNIITVVETYFVETNIITVSVEMKIREYIVFFVMLIYIYTFTKKTYNHQHYLTSVVVNSPQVIHILATAVSITDRKLGVTVEIIKIHKPSIIIIIIIYKSNRICV